MAIDLEPYETFEEPDSEPPTTVCDACSKVIYVSETNTGEPGSEYESCSLCSDCFPTEGKAP